jgi:transcriptional regulator GlxA family with amidase domain
VKKAMALLQADPARMNSIDDLAVACGVARRTLEKHFRRFVGRSPGRVRRELVLEQVRRELLRAQSEASITEIAVRCGVNHLGRLAVAYRRRYGESPSVTRQRRKQGLGLRRSSPTVLSPTVDRPVVTVHPLIQLDRGRSLQPLLPTRSAAPC